MVFVGALANVVIPCDGGRGQHRVVVNYQYFFKDHLHVYTYLSKSEKMEMIKGAAPGKVLIGNYQQLRQLAKNAREKKKSL